MKNYNKNTIRNENRLYHLILLLFKKILGKDLSLKSKRSFLKLSQFVVKYSNQI